MSNASRQQTTVMILFEQAFKLKSQFTVVSDEVLRKHGFWVNTSAKACVPD